MEIVFDENMPKPKASKGKQNMILKNSIRKLLKEHDVKNINKHVKYMEGSGLFDIIKTVGKKTLELGKQGYKIYKDNKETFDKVGEAVIKHAPSVLEILKEKYKGGAVHKKPSKKAKKMSSPKKGKKKASTWIEEVKEVYKNGKKHNHNYTYSEALKDASKERDN